MRRGGEVGFGDAGFNLGDEAGGRRGDPPIGRYLGVGLALEGRRRGDDGSERTPDPFTPGLFSKTDKNDFAPEELCRT